MCIFVHTSFKIFCGRSSPLYSNRNLYHLNIPFVFIERKKIKIMIFPNFRNKEYQPSQSKLDLHIWLAYFLSSEKITHIRFLNLYITQENGTGHFRELLKSRNKNSTMHWRFCPETQVQQWKNISVKRWK